MNLDDLRRARKAKADALQIAALAIDTLEAAGTFDGDEHAQAVVTFEATQADFDRAEAAVKRAEAAEAALAASATTGDTAAPASPWTAPAAAKDPAKQGLDLGLMVHALARSKGDKDKAASFLDKEGHSGISAALSGATDAAGGVTVPRPMAESLIGLLRSRVVVRAAGARAFPVPAGQIRAAKQTASATAGYGAENGAIAASEPGFDKIDQTFKTLTGLVPVGNALLRHSGLAMAELVRDDLVAVMARREDLAFIRGDGTSNTPKGIRNWLLTANWIANLNAGVAATAAAAEAALRRVVSRVEDADVPMVAPGWIMRASAKNFLSNLRDAVGNKLFPSIEVNGTLLGWPIHTTSQIPNNLGTAADETEIYFGDFAEGMIGDSMTLEIGVSSEAAYVDGSGATISAFQSNMTLMRAVAEHDFALAHDKGFAGFNAKGWSL